MRELKNTKIIAVDHGYGNMKTANTVTPTGIKTKVTNGAVDVWVQNWQHVAQLFSYGSAVRKILYTTNAVESVNSSFRKVTKKGAFPNENALLKLLYLRINELYKKWNKRPQNNWALVRNQLDIDEKIQERIRKYENGGF